MSREPLSSGLALLLVLVAACVTPACLATSNGTDVYQEHSAGRADAPVRSSATSVTHKLPSRTVLFETDEGTWMSVDVSPDGKTVVFDLLGDIYLMPAEGGEAIPLTIGDAWDQGPRFSPDGSHVFFVSDRIGYKNLWRISLADRSPEQITHLDRNILGAVNWSFDGSSLLVGIAGIDFTPTAEVLLHSIDPSSGAIMPVEPWTGPMFHTKTGRIQMTRPQKKVFSGAGGAAFGSVFFSENHFDGAANGGSHIRSRIYEFDLETKTRNSLTPEDAEFSEFKPQLSHDGSLVAYYRQYDDRRTELRLLDRRSKQDRVVTILDDAEDASHTQTDDSRPNYSFTPDDGALVFWHAGKIRRVKLTDGLSEVVPFRVNVEREVAARAQPSGHIFRVVEHAKTVRWPNLSRDGRTLVFSAVGYIWVMDVLSGETRRLTESSDFEFMPSISPDGSSVAYVSFPSSWDDYSQNPFELVSGRLLVMDIEQRQPRELLFEPGSRFLLPAWSADGTKIAVIRESIAGNSLQRTFGWTTVSNGAFKAVLSPSARYTNPASLFHYARSVRFDSKGESMLLSYPVSPDKTILTSVDLDGASVRTLAIGASDVGGIAASPDLTKLILTRRDGTLWLAPFAEELEPRAVSTLTPEAEKLSENGGYFADWYDDQNISYGFGATVYRYDMNSSEMRSHDVSVPITRPVPRRPTAYTGARLITLSGNGQSGEVIENGVLVVEQGRIKAVGSEYSVDVPEDAVVVDVAGKTIVPGFIDTHYHAIHGHPSYHLPSRFYSETTAIEYGVTTAWNPGTKADDGAAAHVDLQAAGRVIGPRWSYASFIVGHPYQLLTSHEAASANVERFRDLGVTVMKEYKARTRSQQRWLSAAARQHNLGIVSHIARFDAMMTRIVDGYTGGDHQFIPIPYYEDVHQLLVQSGYVWTPDIYTTVGTLSSFGARGIYYESTSYFCRALNQGQESGQLGDLKIPERCRSASANVLSVAFGDHRIGRVSRQAASSADRGVRVGISGHEIPANNLHIGMWALWKGGMPIVDVLKAVSLVNAEKLGLKAEIGSLEAGKVADFLILDANPLDNVLNTLSLRYTVQGGLIYDAETVKLITPQDFGGSLSADTAANDGDDVTSKRAEQGLDLDNVSERL